MAIIRLRVKMGSFYDKESNRVIRTGGEFEGDKSLLAIHGNLEVAGPVAQPLSESKKVKTTKEPVDDSADDEEDEEGEDEGEDEEDGDDDTYTEAELKEIASKHTLADLKKQAKAAGLTVKKSATTYSLTVDLLNAGVSL